MGIAAGYVTALNAGVTPLQMRREVPLKPQLSKLHEHTSVIITSNPAIADPRAHTQQQRAWASEKFRKEIEAFAHRAGVRPGARPPSAAAGDDQSSADEVRHKQTWPECHCLESVPFEPAPFPTLFPFRDSQSTAVRITYWWIGSFVYSTCSRAPWSRIHHTRRSRHLRSK